jgi:hypothetical protein
VAQDQTDKGTRARLKIISAVIVPANAGSGRMNTIRTPHTNCVLKHCDPGGGWPHSSDTTRQTIKRKCGDSNNTPAIRLPTLIFRQDRQPAYITPKNARTITQSSSKIKRMQGLYVGIFVPASAPAQGMQPRSWKRQHVSARAPLGLGNGRDRHSHAGDSDR